MKCNYNTFRRLADLFCFFSGTLILLASFISVEGQTNVNFRSIAPSRGAPFQHNPLFLSASPTYREDASQLLLREANRIAKELSLPENMPISERNVIRVTVFPPRFGGDLGAIGNVVTSNYIYYVSIGRKFSALTRTHLQQEDNQLKSKYIEPISQMDTNAAFDLATQFLTQASMDVSALNRNCGVRIHAAVPANGDYSQFVPLYFVSWVKRGYQKYPGKVATVEVFLPTKSLRQMHVNDSKYILQQPLQISNQAFLLGSTNRDHFVLNRPLSVPGTAKKANLPAPVFNRTFRHEGYPYSAPSP